MAHPRIFGGCPTTRSLYDKRTTIREGHYDVHVPINFARLQIMQSDLSRQAVPVRLYLTDISSSRRWASSCMMLSRLLIPLMSDSVSRLYRGPFAAS
jgi:hypothetical protein